MVTVVVGRVLEVVGGGARVVVGSAEVIVLPPPLCEVDVQPWPPPLCDVVVPSRPPLVHVEDEMAMSAQARNSS